MTTADVQQQLFSVVGLKETSRVEVIDTAGARCASVEVWVGARGKRACGGARSLAAKCYSSNNCSEVLQGGR